MDKVKKFVYWVTILPPIYNGIKSVIQAIYNAYINTLMEIDTKKQKDEFIQSLIGTKGAKDE